MPARKQPHEFTACEQFGTRYSALGKRIEASVPKGETAVTRTYTSELDIFQLCDSLAVELEDPEAELEYIAQNRRNYYNTHSYMKDKAIGTAYDGPVFPDDIIYCRSSGEKYTVQADGSITTAAGKTYKAPDFQNFIHTLPKQDNPLVEGECKTRTPEEASKAAAKQREQARKKESADPAPADFVELAPVSTDRIVKEAMRRPSAIDRFLELIDTDRLKVALYNRGFTTTLDLATSEDLVGELDRRGDFFKVGIRVVTDEALVKEMERRGLNKTAAALAPTLDAATDAEILGEVTHRDDLFHRIQITALATVSDDEIRDQYKERGLWLGTDGQLADELRRRDYVVKATKLVEL